VVFGAVYQLTHNFEYLTLLAIFLNAFMVAALCCWVRALNGACWIAFLGFSVNIDGIRSLLIATTLRSVFLSLLSVCTCTFIFTEKLPG